MRWFARVVSDGRKGEKKKVKEIMVRAEGTMQASGILQGRNGKDENDRFIYNKFLVC